MCVSFIALNHFEQFPLVVLHNRDEYFARDFEMSQKIGSWQYGLDHEQGGSWYCFSKEQRFCLVLNYRDPKRNDPKALSRGLLPYLFAFYGENFFDFLVSVQDRFKAFNLIFGSASELFYYSNIEKKLHGFAGVRGLSNGLWEEPWEKTQRGEKEILSWPQNLGFEELSELASGLLQSRKKSIHLPETGVAKEIEKELSSLFVEIDGYGTVSSQIFAFRKPEIKYGELYVR